MTKGMLAARTRSASCCQSDGGEDYAEVGDGDIVVVDGVAVGGVAVAGCGGGLEVRDDLVAVEIEVDPVVGAAAFGAGEDGAVEVARGVEVVDWKGDVKGLDGHGSMIAGREGWWPVERARARFRRCPMRRHSRDFAVLPIRNSGLEQRVEREPEGVLADAGDSCRQPGDLSRGHCAGAGGRGGDRGSGGVRQSFQS